MKNSISVRQFLDSIESGRVTQVYLAVGREPLLLDEVTAGACGKLSDPATRDFNLDVLYSDSVGVEGLASVLMSLPMMAERRVVVLRRAETLTPSLQKYLLEYMENPPRETVLVLLADSDGKNAWIRKASAKCTVIRCDPPRKRELESWIHNRCQALGVKIDDDAVAMMMEGREVRLIDLASELEKASLLAGSENVITLQVLQEVWGIRSEINIWTFFDRAASGRRKEALSDLAFLRDDIDRDAGFVLSQIARRLRLAWKERWYDRKRVPPSKRKWSGNTERQWNMASRSLKSLPVSTVEKSLERLLLVDRLRKSKSYSVSHLIEQLLHRIALDRGRASDGA